MAQLTPISDASLPDVLDGFAARLAAHATAARAFARIAATRDLVAGGADLPGHRAAAVDLARSFGIPVLDEPPQAAFSWDGCVLRVGSEASVILHEVAHWQLCPRDRRTLPDFGLGAGPETGRKGEADGARTADFATREDEESASSLLGILWEAALGQPAILAFQEQNWLEGWGRPAGADHFIRTVDRLRRMGYIDADGAPTRRVNGIGSL